METTPKRYSSTQRVLLFMLTTVILMTSVLLGFNLWFYSIKLRVSFRLSKLIHLSAVLLQITTRRQVVIGPLKTQHSVVAEDPDYTPVVPEIVSHEQRKDVDTELVNALDVESRSRRKENEDSLPNVVESSPIEGWYKSGQRYFVYQPSGGISNQRKILEWGVMVAKILNRTLVLPPIAPHTTLYKNYNKLPYDLVAPADKVIDVALLERFVPVVTVRGLTFIDFVSRNENTSVDVSWEVLVRNNLKEKRADRWSSGRVRELYANSKASVLYFKEGTMWQCFDFTTEEMKQVQRITRFHPVLRRTASILASSINNGTYNSLHIRFADGDASKLREGWLKPARTFSYRMQLAKFSTISPYLYIATVPKKRNSAYFAKIKQKYKVLFSSDLPQEPINQALDGFPENLKGSILGVIEQLICARATKFLGTGFSTFSEYIRFVRMDRIIGNDPFIAVTDTSSLLSMNEHRFLSVNSTCTSEVKVC